MERFDNFRMMRSEVYDSLFGAKALCFTGLLVMPAMLFNSFAMLRIVQFLFFWFLCWLAGKKNNPLMTILVILGITAINLIVPYGRVLFSAGAFKITQGALMLGIERAVTLEGLLMLSRLSVRQDLKLPGLFGELMSESFRNFAVIMDSGKRVTRKNFIEDVDALMTDLSGRGNNDKPAAALTRTRPVGFFILSAAALFSWFLFFIGCRL